MFVLGLACHGLGLGLEHLSLGLGLGLACQGLGLGLELLSLEYKRGNISTKIAQIETKMPLEANDPQQKYVQYSPSLTRCFAVSGPAIWNNLRLTVSIDI